MLWTQIYKIHFNLKIAPTISNILDIKFTAFLAILVRQHITNGEKGIIKGLY